MDDATRECYIARCELVLRNMRLCNSACDVHEIAQIRNVACMVMKGLEDRTLTLPDAQITEMICRAEMKCVEYFKKKYGRPQI